MTYREKLLTSALWAGYPQLHAMANTVMDDFQMDALLYVIAYGNADVNLADTNNLCDAFHWQNTPQGHDFWFKVHSTLCRQFPEYDHAGYDPDFQWPPVGGDMPVQAVTPAATDSHEWQPDVVNGASVMDITRSLF